MAPTAPAPLPVMAGISSYPDEGDVGGRNVDSEEATNMTVAERRRDASPRPFAGEIRLDDPVEPNRESTMPST